jgi:general stress protein 26
MKNWETFVNFLKDVKVGALATVDGKKPNVRAVVFVSLEEKNTIYTTTSFSTKKVKEIKENPNVSIFFWKGDDSFRIHGKAEIIENIDMKKKVLEAFPKWKDHYPLGSSDPNYCLIKINISEIKGE